MKKLFIKTLFFCFLTGAASPAVFAQTKPKTKPTPKPAAKATPAPVLTEEQVFEKARKTVSAAERSQNLKKFLEQYPETALKNRVLELIVSARAQEADEKLVTNNAEGGVALFELAIKEAPTPFSEEFFDQVISLIPENLSVRGQFPAAIKISADIEEKVGGNAEQLLDLAKFHLRIENYPDAQRLARKVIELDGARVGAYEVLGSASVTSLQLQEAADAYEKALQINNSSLFIKLYLANIKRALGKPAEALALYQQVLDKDAQNVAARTGKILSLLDAGKRKEAEAGLQEALAANPKNYNLMTGAAYWYAAHNEGDKAVELAQKSLVAEPRYVWSYIALARGMILTKRATEAEMAMLQAAQYGNFPTLHYEMASSKMTIGLYEEAAADLKRSFTLKDGKLEVKLAGRVPQSGDSFTDILALERRASIYEPVAADSAENAAKLKDLLAFDLKLNDAEAKEADLIAAADAFIGGSDQAQTHRRMYAAGRLLRKKTALPKVLEIVQAAVTGIETAAEMPGATTAVLAEELFEPRATALTRGTTVSVPDIPRPVLLNIMRGRVEDLSGWTLFQQQKTEEALVRLRRAVGVLPEKSAWWRSSMWKLGSVLDAAEKPEEAFEAYSKSYASGPPDKIKLALLQGLCQRLYNLTEGCDDKITASSKADRNAKKAASSLLKASPTPAPTPVPPAKTGEPENAAGNNEPGTAPPQKTEPAVIKPAANPPPAEASATPPAEATPTPQATPEPTPAPPQKAEEETPKPEASPSPAAQDEEGRPRTAAQKSEPVAKTGDGKSGVVYSNPNAQVRVRTLGAESGCQVTVNEQKLTLISNGGWGSITIDLKGEGKLEDIKVSTGNPADIAMELQPGIGKDINRRMYVVRSISEKKGEFKIFVESPCGEKKEVLVTVK